jgi:hypothetical protein
VAAERAEVHPGEGHPYAKGTVPFSRLSPEKSGQSP